MKKRLLALLLVAVMVLSLVPMMVFATGTSYAITNGTPESAKETNHGYIAVDETAAEGETVTITVKPNEGYQLKSLTVTPAFTVTFDLNGITGTAPEAQAVEKGGKVTRPDDPSFEGHSIEGWYTTKDETTGKLSGKWDFYNDTVTANMTLYAQWQTTISTILKTTDSIPTYENFDPTADDSWSKIPKDAWVTEEGNKAFKGPKGSIFNLGWYNEQPYQSMKRWYMSFDDTETFLLCGDTYVFADDFVGTMTCYMTDGVFTSLTFAGNNQEGKGSIDFGIYNGTYAPAASTFKAVYDTTGDANTLTFYYDNKDHSGEGITVYEGSTGDNYLFDNLKSNGAKWGYNSIRGSVKSVKIDSSVADYKELTSTTFMFQGMAIATNISGAEYLDVSNVTDMSYMFQNFGGGKSGSPTTLNVVPDVSKWNTGNVTNMTAMFESYGNFSSSLDKVPDVSGWNTGKVTDMTFMFQKYGHESQNFNAVPDVSKWNTGNVTSMKQMFFEYGHKSTALDTVPNVSGWNTGKVTNMSGMFNGYGYTSTNISCVLDLSGWDLSKITGKYGENVFSFNPKTFDVKIPAKTGEKPNEGDKWYYGDGTNFIAPPEGKTFALPLAGALTGVFTVSDPDGIPNSGDEKKVQFSQGNLWYGTVGDAQTATFNFEANQYSSASSWEASHVSHFYWSQSVNSAIAEEYDWNGSADDVFFTNATETTAKEGFTVNVNGKNQQGWRTLSTAEWQYLFNNHSKKWATVNGVGGYVIAPDNVTLQAEKTSYTATELNDANLVFLPAAGYRNGSNVYVVGDYGHYWSSTAHAEDYAYFVSFSSPDVTPDDYAYRKFGCSVRLVTEVKAGDNSAPANEPLKSSAPKQLKSSAPKLLKSSAPVDPETITPIKQQDGTYQFTMPGYAVIVTAEFEVAPTTYTITNGTPEGDKETNHGYISIDKTTAAEGETVTITINPAEGYQPKSLTVTPVAPTIAGALTGEFSVSATKKVYFSQGNLVATIDASGAPTAWKFAANQYESIGANVANTKIGKEAGDIDLFGWSTDAASNNWGIHTKTSETKNFTTGNFKDWGKAVGDGNTWRTLSKAEWTYLFNNHSKKWATVNGVKGYVIAPDGFAGTLSDTYADDAALAANNLVFLPAAGDRAAFSVTVFGSDGFYWSSSTDSEDEPYDLHFTSSSVKPNRTDKRNIGMSVRLVTEVKAGDNSAPANEPLKSPAPVDPETITPEKQQDGTYQFTMPAANVTVTAEFEEIQYAELIAAALAGTLDQSVPGVVDVAVDQLGIHTVKLLKTVDMGDKDVTVAENVFFDLNHFALTTTGKITNNGVIILHQENADIVEDLLYNVPGNYATDEELKLPNDASPDYVIPASTFMTSEVGTDPAYQELSFASGDDMLVWNKDVTAGVQIDVAYSLTLGGDILGAMGDNVKPAKATAINVALSDNIAIGGNNGEGEASLVIKSYPADDLFPETIGTFTANGKKITLNKSGKLVISANIIFDESVLVSGVNGMVVVKTENKTDGTVTYFLDTPHAHNPVLVNGQAATEEAAGWKDYYKCDCGKLFEDAACKVEITDLDAWKAEGGNGYLPKIVDPKPGDASKMMLWMILALFASAGIYACLEFGGRRKAR